LHGFFISVDEKSFATYNLVDVGLLQVVQLNALLVGLGSAVVVVIVKVEVGVVAAVHDQGCDLFK
jgi:hypothetical protein